QAARSRSTYRRYGVCIFPVSPRVKNLDQECFMNWDRIEGDWKQFVGKVKEKWGKLTEDDLAAINGKREQLEGKIQERYDHAKDVVKKEPFTVPDPRSCGILTRLGCFG